MQRLFFALCIVFVCISCRDTRKDSAFQLVREWEGKEIRFPEQSVFTVQGKDTVGFNWSDADYKVLMYVDSTGCMSCKLQLANGMTLSGRPILCMFLIFFILIRGIGKVCNT